MDLPKRLYRWLDEEQAVNVVCGGAMFASWTHLAPDTRRLEKGICFGENGWRWREEVTYVACILLDTSELPSGLRPIHLVGDHAFQVCGEVRALRKLMRKTAEDDVRGKIGAKVQNLIDSFCNAHERLASERDEWFLRGHIPDAHRHVSGMVVLPGQGRRLERIASDMAADGSLPFLIVYLNPYSAGSDERLRKDMAAAVSALDCKKHVGPIQGDLMGHRRIDLPR